MKNRKRKNVKATAQTEAYLFDLGNVLAGFDHMKFCRRLAETTPPWREEDIHRIVFQEGINERFETGRLSGKDFYEELRRSLGVSLSLERLQDLWCDIFHENPGMGSLLEALHKRARLILISNTNPWHLDYVKNRYTFFRHFHSLILSYEIGVLKPHTRIFQAALEAAGSRPDRCLYFDDIEAHVRAAARLGIPSVRFCFASM